MTTCSNCTQPFQIESEDLVFYDKMQVPQPTWCPTCRQMRRLAFRNELFLYKRKSDLSGEEMISMYSRDKPYKVYSPKEWWSDKWDPMEYGLDFDFNRPFFEQFANLQRSVPRMALNSIGNENSDYANYAYRNKNSYLLFTADYNEDSYYGRFSVRNFNCVDFDMTEDSTQCYETLDAKKCTRCFFSQRCSSSSELYFCYNMRNCHNCIGSANLRNKEYYVFNQKVSKEEFEQAKKEMNVSSHAGITEGIRRSNESILKHPRKLLDTVNCDNCIGDYLTNSKNAKYCFDSRDLEDVKFGNQLFNVKDSYDWDFVGAGSELCYEMVSSAYKMQNCKFTMNSWEACCDMQYSELCLNSKNLFGCIALRGKQYCILNKQYSKEEYEVLSKRIIKHMEETGEYGQFFPTEISPFAYNESVAQEYVPLTKEQALERGFKWHDAECKPASENAITAEKLPDDIKETKDDITKQIIICPTCGGNHRIIDQELEFYRKMGVALPRECWKCRHKRRMAKKNPKYLWNRHCGKCNVGIQSTYDTTRPEIVYCEKCYLEEVEQ